MTVLGLWRENAIVRCLSAWNSAYTVPVPFIWSVWYSSLQYGFWVLGCAVTGVRAFRGGGGHRGYLYRMAGINCNN